MGKKIINCHSNFARLKNRKLFKNSIIDETIKKFQTDVENTREKKLNHAISLPKKLKILKFMMLKTSFTLLKCLTRKNCEQTLVYTNWSFISTPTTWIIKTKYYCKNYVVFLFRWISKIQFVIEGIQNIIYNCNQKLHKMYLLTLLT